MVIDCSEVISNPAATWLILSDLVSRSSNQITNCLIGSPATAVQSRKSISQHPYFRALLRNVGHRTDSAARLMTGPRVAVRVSGATAILNQQAIKATVVALTHGGMNTDVRGNAGQDNITDSAYQNLVQRALVADTGANLFAPPTLVEGQIHQFGPVAFASVDDMHMRNGPNRLQNTADRRNRGPGLALQACQHLSFRGPFAFGIKG